GENCAFAHVSRDLLRCAPAEELHAALANQRLGAPTEPLFLEARVPVEAAADHEEPTVRQPRAQLFQRLEQDVEALLAIDDADDDDLVPLASVGPAERELRPVDPVWDHAHVGTGEV